MRCSEIFLGVPRRHTGAVLSEFEERRQDCSEPPAPTWRPDLDSAKEAELWDEE